MQNKKQQSVLGIDPGVALTGWGIVKEEKNKTTAWHYGCIKTNKTYPLEKRLKLIHREIKKIIQKYQPTIVAIEQIFFYKNVKTAISVSQARGVLMLTACEANIPVKEFTPLQVKKAVCGYGRADKQQIQKMIKILLRLKNLPKLDDISDALAIAVCCLVTKNYS